jgi:hypothetical protein
MDAQLTPYNLETFPGGVSSAVSPDLLPQNQTAWGMNADFRGIKVHTRPNFHQRMYLPSGLIQGIGYFNTQGGMLIAVVGGVPYRLRIGHKNSEFSWEQIILPWYNSPIIKQVWMCQTTESFIIQDGQSAAIIYDGSTARRADRLKSEVPIGKMMAYGNGRLWVAIQGNQLVAGDIRTDVPGSELLFTETQYLSGGGTLSFQDNITGLAFIPVTGTSDYGALIVTGRNFVETVRADITSRDAWSTYPGFVTNAMRNVGSPSGWSLTSANQDLMWRDSLGGIRSLNASMSAAYYAQGSMSGGNMPVSREVSRLVDYDSQELLAYASGIYFNNRLLMTSSPFKNKQGGVSHKDLVCLDFAPVSTMQGQSPPAYNGTWQGVNWTKLVSGEFSNRMRAFGVSSDEDGFNRLWEFETGELDDIYISDGTAMTDGTALPAAESPIETFVEYPRVDFGEPKRRKRLSRCDVWMSNISGGVEVTAYWRTDNNQKWTRWDSTTQCAIMTDPATVTPHVWKNLLPEQRPLVKSFSIPDTLDEIVKYSLDVGAGFQIRLAWTGSVKIERIVIWAAPLDESDYANREGQDGTCSANDVTGNEIRYEIPLGNTKMLGVLVDSIPTYAQDINISETIGAFNLPGLVSQDDQIINVTGISTSGGVTTAQLPPLQITQTPTTFALNAASDGTVVLIHDAQNSPTTFHVTAAQPTPQYVLDLTSFSGADILRIYKFYPNTSDYPAASLSFTPGAFGTLQDITIFARELNNNQPESLFIMTTVSGGVETGRGYALTRNSGQFSRVVTWPYMAGDTNGVYDVTGYDCYPVNMTDPAVFFTAKPNIP